MAFVSLYEYKVSQGGYSSRRSYKLLGYKVGKYKSSPDGRVVLYFTEELQRKANLRQGDFVDLKFEPTTKELIVEKVLEGGYKLSGKSRVLRADIKYYPELGLPDINTVTEPKDIHVKRDSIICKLIFNQKENKE